MGARGVVVVGGGSDEETERDEGVRGAERGAQASDKAGAERRSGKEGAEAANACGRGPVSAKTYHQTLRAFKRLCRRDEKLTAAAQLIYRVLLDEANCSYWQDGFLCTLDELEAITHMSRRTIVDARQRLKDKGYIDFTGKPSKYTVYSLVNQEVNREVNHSDTPQTPQGKTGRVADKTEGKKKTSKEERREEHGEREERGGGAGRRERDLTNDDDGSVGSRSSSDRGSDREATDNREVAGARGSRREELLGKLRELERRR